MSGSLLGDVVFSDQRKYERESMSLLAVLVDRICCGLVGMAITASLLSGAQFGL